MLDHIYIQRVLNSRSVLCSVFIIIKDDGANASEELKEHTKMVHRYNLFSVLHFQASISRPVFMTADGE